MADNHMIRRRLTVPQMDYENGRALFASKGCVVCHSINSIGGEDAWMLGAEFIKGPMNPFEFAVCIWRGAEAMMTMQREELGAPIGLTGQELADIIAFVHDAEEQAKFSHEEIPENIEKLIAH